MSPGRLARLRAAVERASDARLGLGLFLAAFLIRVVYLLEIRGSEFSRVLVGDAVAYDAWARAIAQGDWFGHEVFYQAPLYPYFLAVIYTIAGPSAVVVRFLQAALGGASCVLLAAAGRRFFSREVGLVAGVVLALSGPAIFYAGLVHKTALDLFFTTALLYALARLEEASRPRWAAMAGVVLACLALTRENALAWLPVILVWLAWRRSERASTLAIFLAGTLCVLGPVAARNAALGGVPLVTTSQFGVNFYLGNNADADGTYAPLRFGHGSFAQEHDDAIEIAEGARGHRLTPAQVSRYWSDRAWTWISDHPGDWAGLLARKWMLVWGAREIPDSDEPAVYRDASIVLTLTWPLSFGVLVPLALVGLVATWPERRRVGVLVALLLVSAASTALFFVFARYRAPMVPLLALFATVGGLRLASALRARGAGGQGALYFLYFGVAAAAAVATRFPRDEEAHPRAKAYYNLAVTLEAAGDPTGALAEYRAAAADDPAFMEAHVNLGALLARSGDLAGAIAEETEALRLNPDDPTAHTDLANALLQSGRLDEAEAHYGAALRTQPDFRSARDGLEVLRDLRERAPAP
jgi:4-amino-4-deoxy-L-arabinose transferase-like glycosyltransferase